MIAAITMIAAAVIADPGATDSLVSARALVMNQAAGLPAAGSGGDAPAALEDGAMITRRSRRRRRRSRRRRSWLRLDPEQLESDGRSMSRAGLGLIIGGAVGIAGGIVTYIVGAGMLVADSANSLERNDGRAESVPAAPIAVMLSGIGVGLVSGGLLGYGVSLKVRGNSRLKKARYIRATPVALASADGGSIGLVGQF